MKKIFYILIFSSLFIAGCNNPKKNSKTVNLENNMGSSPEDNWVSLIQENSMDGWHYFQFFLQLIQSRPRQSNYCNLISAIQKDFIN